ncbi:hypothetical protein BMF94_4748 [Rhodotorula taiwanensis]|uniref:protein disulfide-isomerase n=1 Tax=Rhodotorula taiwanensis TaxID=741276 RepID=A0A2S5B635_9BASI|nr:hypothetical protein BMF94_4748 [Rhodotorula taiwanensis]
MKLTTATLATALLTAFPAVLAGLEDAKHSTVLTSKNFDGVIASQSEGTLVAFFAPWCGHCKSLEPVWTKIAAQFEGDDRCKVAHLNADEPDAKPLATKYGVSGFPTIKFLEPPSKGGRVEAYGGQRTEEAFLHFLNEKCGTHKLAGGLLNDLAGRIPSLDSLASLYLTPTATRPSLLSSASALASSLSDSAADSPLAAYYVKTMNKLDSFGTDGAELARAWLDKERTRLGKLAGRKGQVSAQKIDEARMKQNILAAFASASASISSAASVASATASSAGSVVSKSASSAASVVSNSASSVSSVASETIKSVVDEASATARQVVDRVKGEL